MVQKRCEVSEEQAGARVDRIVRELTEKSRSEIRGLFDHGCVLVAGRPCEKPGLPLKPGMVVEINYDEHTRYHEKPREWQDPAFDLVFEDDHVIVVDKASHVLTVPTDDGGETNTLVTAVSRYLSQTHRKRNFPALPVHRLDKGTSGLLVFAKTGEAAKHLAEQFKQHTIQRHYLALVVGRVAPKEATIETYLATDKFLQRFSTRDQSRGERAVTHYRVERYLNKATLVDAWLETGRRNQIRVHLAEKGYPILGDKRYKPEHAKHPSWTARRLALHAAKLGFKHPKSGNQIEFESPLPKEFVRFINKTKVEPGK